MASIAKIKNSPPKDIGLSLLILKDKRLYEDMYKDGVDEVIYAFDEDRPYTLDPMGIFKIGIDRENDYIEALYIGRKGKMLIKGRSAKAIRYEIASKELVSQISHALYLGQELAKAEIALKLGKNYLQDVPLFKKPQFIKL
jgi:dihydropteroate synthase-like protein